MQSKLGGVDFTVADEIDIRLLAWMEEVDESRRPYGERCGALPR